MANTSKGKGDKAEREVEKLLQGMGFPARRKLGAGRQDDMGDIEGVPGVVIQVVNWPSDTIRAVREKPIEASAQQAEAEADFAATFVRLKGGIFRVVLTPSQWAAYVRATSADPLPTLGEREA